MRRGEGEEVDPHFSAGDVYGCFFAEKGASGDDSIFRDRVNVQVKEKAR